MAGSERKEVFQHRGVWLWYPSMVEGCPGPWDGKKPVAEAVESWQRMLDYLAARGTNTVFTQFVPARYDWHWGLQWALEFKDYPGVQTIPLEVIHRRQERINRILDHAAGVGIKVYAHHYNFDAPYEFIRTREHLLQKWLLPPNSGWGGRSVDAFKTVCGNMCFNEPDYRDFLKSCWKEGLETFPRLAGFVVTTGEDANCGCPECVADKFRRQMLIRFVKMFVECMGEYGRKPVIRTWLHGRELYDEVPKGAAYVEKHNLFDCVVPDPDPIIEKWLERGHEIWLTPDIYGENAGPITWADGKFFRETMEQSARPGVTGMIGSYNPYHSPYGFRSRVLQINLESFLGVVNDPDFDGEKQVRTALTKIFSIWLAGRIGKAISLYKEMVYGISKVIGEGMEGYTFKWQLWSPLKGPDRGFFSLGTLGLEWDGDLGDRGTTPPAHWRKEVGTVKRLIELVQQNPWREDFFTKSFAPLHSPLKFLDTLVSDCDKAQGILESVRDRVPAASEEEFFLLQDSCRTARCLGAYWAEAIRSRLFYEGALNEKNDLALRRQLAQRSLESYEQLLKHGDALARAVMAFPPEYYDIADFHRRWAGEIRDSKMQEFAEFRKDLAHLAQEPQMNTDDRRQTSA